MKTFVQFIKESITRRGFLKGAGAAIAATKIPKTAKSASGPPKVFGAEIPHEHSHWAAEFQPYPKSDDAYLEVTHNGEGKFEVSNWYGGRGGPYHNSTHHYNSAQEVEDHITRAHIDYKKQILTDLKSEKRAPSGFEKEILSSNPKHSFNQHYKSSFHHDEIDNELNDEGFPPKGTDFQKPFPPKGTDFQKPFTRSSEPTSSVKPEAIRQHTEFQAALRPPVDITLSKPTIPAPKKLPISDFLKLADKVSPKQQIPPKRPLLAAPRQVPFEVEKKKEKVVIPKEKSEPPKKEPLHV